MAEKIEIVAELKDLVSGHLKDITSQVDRLDSSLKSVGRGGVSGGGGGGIMGQVIGANLLTGAIEKAAGATFDFYKGSLDAYGRQEQFLVSLKTLFQGNEKEADVLNSKLLTLAKTTPFELTEIQDATRMMIALGSTSGGVTKEIRMLGDVSSGMGQSIKEIAYLYGTARAQGRLYAQDFNQFTTRGVINIDKFAKQLGIGTNEVKKYVEDGKVGFKEVEKYFQNATSAGGQFFNMMNEQSKTQVGQLSNLSDAWDQFKSSVGSSFSEAYKGGISFLTEQLNTLNDLMIDVNKNFKTFEKAGVEMSAFEKAFNFKDVGELVGLKKYTDKAIDYADTGDKESGIAERGLQAYKKKLAEEYNTQKLLAETSGEDGPDATKFLRQIAVIEDALGSIKESNRSRKSEADAKKNNAKEPAKLETLAKQNRQTVTNVTINNLVGELNNIFQNSEQGFKASLSDMARAVSQVLTGAVNDISVLDQR
jgi:tape measure domain-containing protein